MESYYSFVVHVLGGMFGFHRSSLGHISPVDFICKTREILNCVFPEQTSQFLNIYKENNKNKL